MKRGRSRDPCASTAFWSRFGDSIRSRLLPCFKELYRVRRYGGALRLRADAGPFSSVIPLIKRESTGSRKGGPSRGGVAIHPDLVLDLKRASVFGTQRGTSRL